MWTRRLGAIGLLILKRRTSIGNREKRKMEHNDCFVHADKRLFGQRFLSLVEISWAMLICTLINHASHICTVRERSCCIICRTYRSSCRFGIRGKRFHHLVNCLSCRYDDLYQHLHHHHHHCIQFPIDGTLWRACRCFFIKFMLGHNKYK